MSEGFWWAALAIAGVSASAHLLSMLGTRWGDRKISSKSLLFSLMLHLSLLFGLFAVGPRLDRLTRSSEPTPPELESTPIAIREIVTDPAEPLLADATGDSPVWDLPNETPAPTPERTDRPEPPPETVPDERENVEPAPRPTPAIDMPATLPETAPAVPEVAAAETPALNSDVQTPTLDEETAESRTEERPPLARSDRIPAAAADEAMPLERSDVPAKTNRVDETFDPQMQLADLRNSDAPADLPAMPSPSTPLDVQRPTAPAPTPDVPESGSGEPAEIADADRSSRFRRRPGRSPDFDGDSPETERAAVGGNPAPASSGPDLAMSRIDGTRPSEDGMPSLSRPDAAPLSDRREGVPEAYQLRQLDRRSDIARQHGGTAASEEAVERSLKWLAASQHADGYWDADAHGAGQIEVDDQGVKRNNAGKTADSGLTALAILAFLGAGYTHEDGEYAETVDKALDWLVAHQRDDGFLGDKAAHFEQMYCHGMATYALAEAYGMRSDTSNESLRRPLERAILYIAAMQGEDGGWRYEEGQAGDMSMFGWQLMALKSAEIAGVPMPGKARNRMILFLRERSLGKDGGLAAYRKTDPQIPPTPAMTAEALFSKQILGMTRTNPASLEAVAYLLKNTPKRSELNYYYWYYGTLAMFQYGGAAWDRWNTSLRDLLIAEQIKNGPDAGSWPPRDAWGPYGGRVYSTAVATLSLEVYYRFLPLYRAVELPKASPPVAEPRVDR